MTRVLRNLKIREVSAVDKGAGEGTRIALWKRDPAANFRRIFGAEMLSDVLARAEANKSLPRFAKQDGEDPPPRDPDADLEDLEDDKADAERRREEEVDDDELTDEAATSKQGHHHAEVVADLLLRAGDGRFPDHASALYYVLHTPRGAALLRRLSPNKLTKKGRTSMTHDRAEELSAICKRYGIGAIAKKVVDDCPGGLSEHEMTKLITEAAQREHPGLSSASAFARIYSESSDRGMLLRKAVGACKTFATQTQPAHRQAVGSSGSAYDALLRKADELRVRDPSLSREMAFSKVFTAPENAELARAERQQNRPSV
jgi:hypothetical protein